jgi:hypothetical protein
MIIIIIMNHHVIVSSSIYMFHVWNIYQHVPPKLSQLYHTPLKTINRYNYFDIHQFFEAHGISCQTFSHQIPGVSTLSRDTAIGDVYWIILGIFLA